MDRVDWDEFTRDGKTVVRAGLVALAKQREQA
jgi:hypothetical protein